MASTWEPQTRGAVVPPEILAAARILRWLGWLCLLVPAAALVYTFPVGFFLLLLGGALVVAPPVTFGLVGLRLARALRHGHYALGALVFAGLQGGLLLLLAGVSTSWDATSPGEGTFYWIVTFTTFLAGAASLGAAALIAASAGRIRIPQHAVPPPPAVGPWVFGGVVLLGIAAVVTAVVAGAG